MLKWVNRYCALYSDTRKKIKICDINIGTVVESLGESNDGVFEEVKYTTHKQVYIGFLYADDLEKYVRNQLYDLVFIENQTPNPNDLKQYVIHEGNVQTNMCGQICIAYILGISLKKVLDTWKENNLVHYKAIFKTPNSAGTGPSDLISILKTFSRKAIHLNEALFQKHINRSRYTIKGLNALLEKGDVIFSVHINTYTGLIENTGALHWVVLKSIHPERNGQGLVYVYNPAMNSIEFISWKELLRSMSLSPYGVFIPKV